MGIIEFFHVALTLLDVLKIFAGALRIKFYK